ncbi:hypothetical protein KFL_007190040 [Klebsormidium nitens]|uniref:U-box domain-containing protein n=1 Tax=Klebsormidium nitens TaxID=105231 RepID=A0A1Y1INK3_KLENI|nr:hypothetical protein KFL_007190040 [Klebsormidium nitens]|eukprot:GAQ91049.1 hypothetical protein KFL_007190040 [Klebsormidium nitens]
MSADPLYVVQSVVALGRGINDAFQNLKFHKTQGGVLNSRIQRLRARVEELQGRRDLAQQYDAALHALQLQFKAALRLFQECSRSKVYRLLNHQRIRDGIIDVNQQITYCLVDIDFIGGDIVNAFRNVNPLRYVDPLLEGVRLPSADLSSPRAVLRAVTHLQQTGEVTAQDVAQYRADLEALERQNRELQTQLSSGCAEADESFMAQVIGLLKELDEQLPSPGGSGELEVPETYKCPISGDVMGDPVIIVETYITYERSQIEKWFGDGHRTCPVTNQHLESTQVIPNLSLRDQIQGWARNAGVTLRPPSAEPPPPPSVEPDRALPRTLSRQDSEIAPALKPLEPRIRPGISLAGLTDLAEDGDPQAQFELAQCFLVPARGAPYDAQKGFKWAKRAATGGVPEAWALVAEGYYHGTGTAQNVEEGIKCAQKAVQLPEPAAKFILGEAYEGGLGGLPKDPETAAELFKKGLGELKRWADEPPRDPLAQQALGLLYLNGHRTEKDEEQGLMLIGKAAAQGAVGANAFLGKYHKQKGQATAFPFIMRAAEQGHAASQYVLGSMYQNGQGVTRKPAQAYEWFAKAAAGGNALAQLALAECFDDRVDPIKYLTLAADQGNAEAAYQLGIRRLTGKGVKKDRKLGLEFLYKAADLNHKEAKEFVRAESSPRSAGRMWRRVKDSLHTVAGAGKAFV